ncbi:MAG: DUF4190 domain-containing protein [Micrococcales bacterium]|nr:DUF4190 domain-containing protein [Micrococcales bacterium]
MAVCTECASELGSAWRFCIRCGTAVPLPARAHANAAASRAPVNPVAVLALVLGALASPLAAVLGPVALAQLRASGERGRRAALVATVLGAGWTLLAIAVVVILVRRG